MPGVSSGRPPLTVRGRRVVRELRRLREQKGWTLEEAAARSHISAATISRTEGGESLRPANVAALLAAYEVTGDEQRQLVTLAKQAQRKGWWSGIDQSVMSWPYKNLTELEQEAAWKKSFEPLLVPGLLQIPEYAEVVLRSVFRGLSEDIYAKKVGVRMRRQERVGKFEFSVLLLEEVLHRPLGGHDVMVKQLRRLLDESTTGRVEIKIVPYSTEGHPGIIGSFSFLGGFSPLDAVVAFVEAPAGSVLFEDEKDILYLRQHYEALEAESLSVTESRRLLERISREMESRGNPGGLMDR